MYNAGKSGATHERTVRGEGDIVRLSHVGNPLRLGNTTRVRNVGLDNVNAAGLEVRADILSGEETLSKGDGDGRLRVQLLKLGNLLGEKGLLDEEGLVGFEDSGKLLRHALVDTAVEVETDIQADRPDGGAPLGRRLESGWRV